MIKTAPAKPERFVAPERVLLPMPTALLEAVEDFRYTERIPSRAEAIRELIEAGLAAKGKKVKK